MNYLGIARKQWRFLFLFHYKINQLPHSFLPVTTMVFHQQMSAAVGEIVYLVKTSWCFDKNVILYWIKYKSKQIFHFLIIWLLNKGSFLLVNCIIESDLLIKILKRLDSISLIWLYVFLYRWNHTSDHHVLRTQISKVAFISCVTS